MSLARRLVEARSATLKAPPQWLHDALTAGGGSYSGKSVTPDSSMQLIPVWSAVSLLSGAVASLPMIVYRSLAGDERERAQSSRQWSILHDQPNPELAADEMWEIVMAHLLLWGNAFLAKVRSGDGRLAELWPIRPSRVQVARRNGEKVFVVDGDGPFTEVDILHIRGLGTDGLVGLSPIQQAKQQLGNQLAREEFTGRFWAEGTMLSGFLKHPNRLDEDAAKRLAKSWRARFAGVGNAGKTVVLEEGLNWEQAGMPLADAQFIEQEKLGDLRVAQLYRLPPYMLGAEIGSSLTYSTTESQGIDFVRWSLNRWLKRIEKSLLRDPALFPPSLKLEPEFLVDALLRADTKTRYEAYGIGIKHRFITPNDARRKENLPPVDGGDDFPDIKDAPAGPPPG